MSLMELNSKANDFNSKYLTRISNVMKIQEKLDANINNQSPIILILSERGVVFTGSGEFIRRTKRAPGEAREA